MSKMLIQILREMNEDDLNELKQEIYETLGYIQSFLNEEQLTKDELLDFYDGLYKAARHIGYHGRP